MQFTNSYVYFRSASQTPYKPQMHTLANLRAASLEFGPGSKKTSTKA